MKEILEAAIVALQRRGWCQGIGMDSEGRVCAYGAIDMATRGLSISEKIRISRFVNEPTHHVELSVWNDVEGRTVEDVVELFVGAIERCDA